MRMKLLKIVVVLLVAGSGDGRPQAPGAAQPETSMPSNVVEWKPVRSLDRSRDYAPGDSRYTGNAGRSVNRRSYYYNPSFEDRQIVFNPRIFTSDSHRAINRPLPSSSSNARFLANPIGTSRRSKIDPTWGSELRKSNLETARFSPILPSSNRRRIEYSRVPNGTSKIVSNVRSSSNHHHSRGSSLNNSKRERTVALGLNSVLEGNSSRNSVRVRPSRTDERFDQVEAIRRITSVLTDRDVSRKSDRLVPNVRIRSTVKKDNDKNRVSVESASRWNLKVNRPKHAFVPSEKIKTSQAQNENADVHFKNWPNEALQDIQDLYNYEKYTSFQEQESFEDAHERPVSLNGSAIRPESIDSSVQEIIQWLKIPAFAGNFSQTVENRNPDYVGSTFDDGAPSRPIGMFQSVESPDRIDGGAYHNHWQIADSTPQSDLPNTLTPYDWYKNNASKNITVFNPTTKVSQNTVVQILGNSSKIAVTPKPLPPLSQNSSVSHANASDVPNKQETHYIPVATVDAGCPTITINSYTKVNNTVQSKEGCADLNIVINSHVLNTNVFKPTANNHTQSDQLETDSKNKYNNILEDPDLGSTINYPLSSEVYTPNYNTYQPSKNDDYNPQKNPDRDEIVTNDEVSSISTVEIVQDTQISVSGINSQNNGVVTEPPKVPQILADVAEDLGGFSPEDFPESPEPPATVNDPISSAVGTGDTGPTINLPTVQDMQLGTVPGVVVGQSHGGGPLSGSLQLPNIPSISNIPPVLASQVSGGLIPSSSSPQTVSFGSNNDEEDDDDDDDEEDEVDLSPGGLMESIASIYTYFSYMNPLNYGFFSLAAAPFAAMAAGVLGIAAFLVPWALPGVFDLGRSMRGKIGLWPSLEERVKRSLRSAQSNDTQRHLKDLQYINQSLRTVATQLLNVTTSDEAKTKESSSRKPEKKTDIPATEISSNAGQSVSVGFGRPINSKFGFFESGHPGQAMALTEEELEREMSSTRLMTAYKNHPTTTTTGGISTWILLNPPSTTGQPMVEEKKQTTVEIHQEIRLPIKTTPFERVETKTERIDKPTQLTTTPITRKPTLTTPKKPTTSTRPERTTENLEKLETFSSSSDTEATRRETISTIVSTSPATPTTLKKVQIVRTTAKLKSTTPKTTVFFKNLTTTTTRKPVQQPRPKPTASRKTTTAMTTTKQELKTDVNSTAKIEKVTFRPIQMITTTKNKLGNSERPMFVTKIKASILTDGQRTTPIPSSSGSTVNVSGISNLSDLIEIPVRSKPIGTKVNNVLKVQLKKPLEDSTKIEIEPIKVSAPVLKIEKVDKDNSDKIDFDKHVDALVSQSKISNVKFDFNPELTKINVETTESSTASSTTAVSTTTTKRPRNNSKRKKNKSRRRKPSTTTPTTTLSTTVSTESNELSTEIALDNAIQESKIEPESKIASNKTKKKAPPKAISTQIYNFLSREVMPSFGVMSLVGLGLGLASYFLYPFGSTITRRNYEVEPNYKYNMDEYGGNYGQNEEEVLSKVLQGMTNHESKYPQKGFEDYYRYQHYEGAYDTQTRKTERHPPSSSPVYRPSENTATILKYRNTEFRYPEVQTTPNYYERQKQSEFVVGQELPGNRQFVVGNIPKEYSYNEKIPALTTKKPTGVYESKENNQQNQYDRDVPQNFHFPPNPVQTYGHPEPQTTRSDEGYEEIEITPTAVAVEHGPRSLKVKRSILDDPAKKESVIQVIPSKRELEEAEKQSDLSNEILDIIDSALPGGDDSGKDEENEVEDVDAQKKKREEEEKTRLKESTMKTLTTENTEKPMSTENVTSSTVVSTEETSSTSTPFTESSSKLSTREPDESIEWTETTTKNPKRDENFNIFSFVKKVAEIKFRLGLTILKHASEGFARYLGNVQKRLNGEE